MRHIASITVFLLATLNAFSVYAQPKSMTVVELFTSQGCYSCPPADAFLGQLARQDNVIALACHVTYWNYLGWQDTFSQSFCDARQQQYQAKLIDGYRGVYTPQMIINGRYAGVGSRTQLIQKIIAYDQAHQAQVLPIKLEYIEKEQSLRLTLPKITSPGSFELHLLGTTGIHSLPIIRGENAGKQLSYAHPIAFQQKLGRLSGQNQVRTVALPKHPDIGQWVVLVQQYPIGQVLAAGKLTLSAR